VSAAEGGNRRFGAAIRPAFLLEDGIAFLNHGSFGATPRAVMAAAEEWRQRMERQPVRFMATTLRPALREALVRLAAFVGARPGSLAFVENATAGANAVLRSLDLAPGDGIAITTHGYGAVRNTVRYVAGRAGLAVHEAQVPFPIDDADAVVAAVEAALGPRTKLAVLDHITSPTGLVFPIERLVALCRARGIAVLVDGAHAPGMVPLDLDALGADWYVGNCHKWLCAPKGAAFLHARADRQDAIHPLVISHGFGQGFATEFEWVGTRDFSSWLAVPTAIEFVTGLGFEAVAEHNRALVRAAAARIRAEWGVAAPAPEDLLGFMTTLPLAVALPGTVEAARAVHDRLWRDHRIEVPIIPFGGRLWVRISAQVYNAPEDYEGLARLRMDPGWGDATVS